MWESWNLKSFWCRFAVIRLDTDRSTHSLSSFILLLNQDERWKKSRRAIGPCFSNSVVVTYLPIFNKQSAYCVNELRKYVGRDTFNIRTIVEEATVFSFVHSTLDGDISQNDMRRYAEIVSKYSMNKNEHCNKKKKKKN